MRRRDFIAGLGSVAAQPGTVLAQQSERVRRVAVLIGGPESDPQNQLMIEALRGRLRQLGWNANGNLRIVSRFGEGDLARGRTYAAELVATDPDVLLSDNTPLVQEFQRLSRTIPIVFASLADPVASGIVSSLARPGRNATGFMNPEPAISGRWLELLKEVPPQSCPRVSPSKCRQCRERGPFAGDRGGGALARHASVSDEDSARFRYRECGSRDRCPFEPRLDRGPGSSNLRVSKAGV
jgi:hypothetical protein